MKGYQVSCIRWLLALHYEALAKEGWWLLVRKKGYCCRKLSITVQVKHHPETEIKDLPELYLTVPEGI